MRNSFHGSCILLALSLIGPNPAFASSNAAGLLCARLDSPEWAEFAKFVNSKGLQASDGEVKFNGEFGKVTFAYGT